MTQNSINTDIPIEITNGGTQATTLTDHGVLLGSGTSAITAAAVGATNTVLIGTTGADASFSATPQVTSISFGDDALANYDEGTWTPVLTFGGGSTGLTYGTQVGTYTRIGNVVYCYIQIILTSKGTSNGNNLVSGLPFTSLGGENFQGVVGRTQFLDLIATETVVTLENTGATTTMILQANGDASGGRPMTDADFANNTALTVNFWYHT